MYEYISRKHSTMTKPFYVGECTNTECSSYSFGPPYNLLCHTNKASKLILATFMANRGCNDINSTTLCAYAILHMPQLYRYVTWRTYYIWYPFTLSGDVAGYICFPSRAVFAIKCPHFANEYESNFVVVDMKTYVCNSALIFLIYQCIL